MDEAQHDKSTGQVTWTTTGQDEVRHPKEDVDQSQPATRHEASVTASRCYATASYSLHGTMDSTLRHRPERARRPSLFM